MSEPSPQIDYQSPLTARPAARYPFLQFFLGVVAGLAVAAAGFAGGTNPFTPVPLLVAIALEFIAGIFVVILSRRYVPFGIGLITAVPMGILLFFVGCAILIAFNK